MNRKISLLMVIFLLVSLSACGGGGGASSNSVDNTDGTPPGNETQSMSVMMTEAMSASESDDPMEFNINQVEDDLGEDETAYASQFPIEDN